MCRWLAYSGDPVLETTNGDGFGVGWSTWRSASGWRTIRLAPWREVPEATCVAISGGRDELRPFAPGPESAPGRSGVTATRT
jgi:hypothetical protein